MRQQFKKGLLKICDDDDDVMLIIFWFPYSSAPHSCEL